ncbi:MAG TPA: FtsX-like permease family protein [Solirubrobacterales bacterium]
MLGLGFRNFSARKFRALSTALAVFFGVAMVAGTLLLSDSVDRAINDLFTDVNEDIDVIVRPRVEVEGEFGEGPRTGFPESVLEAVRAADGVAHAEGLIADDQAITILGEDGERIGPPQGGPPHIALSVMETDRFEALEVVDGRRPESDNEFSLDQQSAEDAGFEIGDRVRITGATGTREYTLVGLTKFGEAESLLGASLAQFTLPEARRLTEKPGRFDEVDVEAAEGTEPEALAAALDRRLPDTLQVATGSDVATEDAGDLEQGFGFLSTALLVFAGIAVFVGGFLIFNTFAITVAQRVREFAMLRTLGASARQILLTVLVEAALIGLLASVLGIAGGFGFVELIKALFSSMGFTLPVSSLRLDSGTILIALIVGVGSTLVAALFPALRATRVAPLEALRESGGSLEGAERKRRRRTVIAAIVALAGAVFIALGLTSSGSVESALSQLGLGLVLLFIGVAMLGGRFVPPIASAIGWPIDKLRGVTGHLARQNAQRQPGRTATTAAALMIGVALVVFVGVFSASLKASISETLDRQFSGDLAILNQDGFSPIPSAIATEVGELDGVAVATPLTSIPARIEDLDQETFLGGLERSLPEITNLEWVEGDDETLRTLPPDGAIVEAGWGEDNGVGVGDEVELTGPGGETLTVTVAGSIRDPAGLFVGTLSLPRETLREQFGARGEFSVLVGFEDGADPDATRAAVDELLAERFPVAEARNQQELKDEQAQQVDQLVTLIYVLLGLAVIVSVFGIVNTLALTILERTRELAMLRAIGTSRSQIRRMVRYESVINALLGTIVGAVIGLALASLAVNALEEEGLVLSIPVALPIVVLIAAIVLGVLAAIGPARRTSKLDLIEALQYE